MAPTSGGFDFDGDDTFLCPIERASRRREYRAILHEPAITHYLMNESQVRQIVEDELKKSQYRVGGVPIHTHNGIDSPKLDTISLVAGVSKIIAGTDITISPTGGTGNVTINSSAGGVSSVTGSGSGISVSPTTGAVVVQNTGVTSLTAGTNITLSATVGGITISAASGSPTRTIGWNSWAMNSSSGTQTIAHGLGSTPAIVRINTVFGASQAEAASSFGLYDGTHTQCVYWGYYAGSASASGGTSIDMIYILTSGSGQTATIGIDSTNITLSWIQVSGGATGTCYFTWECES